MDEAGVVPDVEGEPGRVRELDWNRCFGGYQIYDNGEDIVMIFDLPNGKKWKKRIWPRMSYPQKFLRWNTVEEILSYLVSFDQHEGWVTETIPNKPPSGSIFFFNKEKTKRYRSDGYEWKTRRCNERSVREDRMKLKVRGYQLLYGCYTHSASNPNFHRRSYWLIQNPNLIMVHYLEVDPDLAVASRELQDLSDLTASMVPSNWEFLTISDGNFCALMNGVHSPEQTWELFKQLSQAMAQNIQRARDLQEAIEMNNTGLPCDPYEESRPKRQRSNERKGVPILIGSSSEAGSSSGGSGGEGREPRMKRLGLPKVLSVSTSGSHEQSVVPNGVSKGLSESSHIILCFPKDSSMSYVLLNSGPMRVSGKLDRSIHRIAKPKQERNGTSSHSEEPGLGEAPGTPEGDARTKWGGTRGKGKGKQRASKRGSTSNRQENLPFGLSDSLKSLMQPVDSNFQPPQSHTSSVTTPDTPNPVQVPGTKTSSDVSGPSKPQLPKKTSLDYDPNKFSKFANFLVNMDPLEQFGGGMRETQSGSEEEEGVSVYSTPMDTPVATNEVERLNMEELEAQDDDFDFDSDSTSQDSEARPDGMEIGFSHGSSEQILEREIPHLLATPLSWLVPPTVLIGNGHDPLMGNGHAPFMGNGHAPQSLAECLNKVTNKKPSDVPRNSDPLMGGDTSSSLSSQQTLSRGTGEEERERGSVISRPTHSDPAFDGHDTHHDIQYPSTTMFENGGVFIPRVPASPANQGDSSQESDAAFSLSPLHLSPATLAHLLRSSGTSESPLPSDNVGQVSQFLLQDPSCGVRSTESSSNPEVQPLSPLSRLIENMTPGDIEGVIPSQVSQALGSGGGDTRDEESTGIQNGIYDGSGNFGSVPISQTLVPNPELRITTAPPSSVVVSTSGLERATERTPNVTVSPASAGVWTPCMSYSGSPESIRQWLESTLTTGCKDNFIATQPDTQGISSSRMNLPHNFDNPLLFPGVHTTGTQEHLQYLQSHTHASHMSHSHVSTDLHSVTEPTVSADNDFESALHQGRSSQTDCIAPLSVTPAAMSLRLEGNEHDCITGSEIVGQDANWAAPLPEPSQTDAYHDTSEIGSDDWRGSGSLSGHSRSHSTSFEDHLYAVGVGQLDESRQMQSTSLECLDTEVDQLNVPLPLPHSLCGSSNLLSPQGLPNLSYADEPNFGGNRSGFRSPNTMGTRSPRSPRISLAGPISPLPDITEGVQMELESPVHTLVSFEGNSSTEANLYDSYRPVCSPPIPSSPSLASVSSSHSTVSSRFDSNDSPSVIELCELLSQSSNVHWRDFSHMTLSDGEEQELLRAAEIIQNAFRKYKSRRQMRAREKHAALLIENYYKRYRELKQEKDQAARRIQVQYRMYRSRMRELDRAARFIQQMYRYHRVRQYDPQQQSPLASAGHTHRYRVPMAGSSNFLRQHQQATVPETPTSRSELSSQTLAPPSFQPQI